MQVYAQLAVFLMLIVYGGSVKLFPTIPDEEAGEIINCFAYSCNQTICDAFLKCSKEKMTKRVFDADYRCALLYNPNVHERKCDATHDLYPSDEVSAKVTECIQASFTDELSESEMQDQREFEICILPVYDQCKVLPKCHKS